MKVAIAAMTMGALLLTGASARANWFSGRDDCAPSTRDARGEYQAEHRRAKELQDLDCAGLTCRAEASRMAINMRYFSLYNRPLAAPTSRPPARPSTSILPPTETLLLPPTTTPPAFNPNPPR